MFDAANARRLMVEGQVRTADVTDADLLEAMQTLPRERFLPASLAPLAYMDSDIPLANGRALLKPMVLAKLIQAAQVSRADRVLDVGCATGYSSAVLAALAGSVVALEEDADLARQAKEFACGGWRRGSRGRDRAADGGMGLGRALRRDFTQRRDRNRARHAWPAAQAGWSLGRRSWALPGVQGHDLPFYRRPYDRPSYL